MILTSSHTPAHEELVGRELQNRENIALCGSKAKGATQAERQNAALQMRYQLYLMDRSQHRMSIEELAADLLDHPGAELPA